MAQLEAQASRVLGNALVNYGAAPGAHFTDPREEPVSLRQRYWMLIVTCLSVSYDYDLLLPIVTPCDWMYVDSTLNAGLFLAMLEMKYCQKSEDA